MSLLYENDFKFQRFETIYIVTTPQKKFVIKFTDEAARQYVATKIMQLLGVLTVDILLADTDIFTEVPLISAILNDLDEEERSSQFLLMEYRNFYYFEESFDNEKQVFQFGQMLALDHFLGKGDRVSYEFIDGTNISLQVYADNIAFDRQTGDLVLIDNDIFEAKCGREMLPFLQGDPSFVNRFLSKVQEDFSITSNALVEGYNTTIAMLTSHKQEIATLAASYRIRLPCLSLLP